MNKLEKEKKRVETRFEQLKVEAVEHEKKMKEALTEMSKLQAQYEILEKLLTKK
jgi:chromosome segregation ATPase